MLDKYKSKEGTSQSRTINKKILTSTQQFMNMSDYMKQSAVGMTGIIAALLLVGSGAVVSSYDFEKLHTPFLSEYIFLEFFELFY